VSTGLCSTDPARATARSVARRQKSLERESIGGKTRNRKRGDRSRCARHRDHSDAGLQRRTDETKAWIGNRRRTRIGDQRDLRARNQPLDHFRHAALFVMLKVADRRGGNLMAREHLSGPPRIFACDQISVLESANSARGNVVGITNWSCDYI